MPTLANGEACGGDEGCISGICDADICTECRDADDCGGAACNDATAELGYSVCAEDLGAACSIGAECASGRCFPSVIVTRCSECDGDGVAGGCAANEICQGQPGSYAICVPE